MTDNANAGELLALTYGLQSSRCACLEQYCVSVAYLPTLIYQVFQSLSTIGRHNRRPCRERCAQPAVAIKHRASGLLVCLEDRQEAEMLKRSPQRQPKTNMTPERLSRAVVLGARITRWWRRTN